MYIIHIIFKGFYMYPWVHIHICTLLSRESDYIYSLKIICMNMYVCFLGGGKSLDGGNDHVLAQMGGGVGEKS